MTRTAKETARTLISIYEERFANESYNQFRITWPELRALAGVAKLTDEYLREVTRALNKTNFALISLANFLVVTLEWDLTHIRSVPPRIFEQFLPDNKSDEELEPNDGDGNGEPRPKRGPRSLRRFARLESLPELKKPPKSHVTA